MRWMIFGITGQDSSYLAELLIDKGEKVCGVMRRSSLPTTERIEHLFKYEGTGIFELTYGDLSDDVSIRRAINKFKPDVIVNLAAQSHVGISFDNPISTAEFNAIGPVRILEAIKDINPKIKFYQASSSEMFGSSPPPQDENTHMHPQSPYGCAKLYAYHMTKLYRNAYGLFASNGILFNHESPRRGFNFVTRKITLGIAKIVAGEQDKLVLGNLSATRDWGFSKDYMEAVIKIMEHDKPDDFVIATDETYSIQEFLEYAFDLIGCNWEDYVEISDRYKRPAEVQALKGVAKKAEEVLDWKPKTKFKELVEMMLKNDLLDIAFKDIEEAKRTMGNKR